MKYKKFYGRVDKDMLNTIDNNMKKVSENYWKMGSGHYPRKFMASYVSVIMKCEETGVKKKEIMGPYSKKIAQSIMTDYLALGMCSWVEEDYIR